MGYGVTPDILTSAKALGNGYPIGAMLTTNEIAAVFGVGTHGTTYGGNPLAATVALAVLEQMLAPGFLDRVKEAGKKVRANLEGLVRDYPEVFTAVRGAGLLLGAVVGEKYKGRAKDITKAFEAQGMLALIAGPDVVRLAPALIVSDEQIAQADKLMRAGIDAFLSTPAGK
jgi:acetylornithine/N-succinyldiaminopimelate aminotransferase/succinylornithine aminotransferase